MWYLGQTKCDCDTEHVKSYGGRRWPNLAEDVFKSSFYSKPVEAHSVVGSISELIRPSNLRDKSVFLFKSRTCDFFGIVGVHWQRRLPSPVSRLFVCPLFNKKEYPINSQRCNNNNIVIKSVDWSEISAALRMDFILGSDKLHIIVLSLFRFFDNFLE